MKQYQTLLKQILVENANEHGVHFNRETRSGFTAGIFGANLEFDMRKGFPAVTTKKLPFKAVVGELLWFLNGENTLTQLRHRSEIEEGKWTIWTQDCERFNKAQATPESDDLGRVYGVQWRDWYEGHTDTYHDQIRQLVYRIQDDPMSRYHIVSAWNAGEIGEEDMMALPPCHMMFQVYVTEDGFMDLMWYQRSVDAFLGLPFNIASYGLLLTILARATGYRPRMLKATLGDVHIYEKHFDQVLELLDREPMPLPVGVKLPKVLDKSNFFEYIDQTASAYELVEYHGHPAIKAPLLVGDVDEGGDGVNPPTITEKEVESSILILP